MKLTRSSFTLLALTSAATLSTAVSAQELYLSGSIGLIDQSDSSNAGIFTSQFVTGAVTGVTPPLTIPAGSDVGWNTEFEQGDFFTAAFGAKLAGFRLELEHRESSSDVDTHRGVNAAGLDLSALDAGVLISGNSGDLGVSVADLVAAGGGYLDNNSLMVNGYYDFNLGGALTPYLGLGLGNSDSEVAFAPSGTSILRGSDDGFAYQLVAGVSFSLTQYLDIFLNYRYMDGEDFSVSASLLPASFEIENKSQSLDVGLRFSF